MMGLDFDPHILFGNNTVPAAPPQLCSVQSHHPQKVTKFCKCIISQCNHHLTAEHLAAFQQLDIMEPHHYAELECIDQQLLKILINADQTWTPQNPVP